MELYTDLPTQYADFAGYARGESPCFEEWSLGVAGDEKLMDLIGTLPPVKQQPNLVFAAARWHGVPAPAPYRDFRTQLLRRWEVIRATVLQRSTQTNEVGRLATLVPALTEIQRRTGRPLALLEVGASAGLCLYPDRYEYRWSTEDRVRSTGPTTGEDPPLGCAVTGSAPLPSSPPAVAWRGGVDLNPLDVRDDDAMAWLENLVWPEQEDRLLRLRRAIAVARREPPLLVRGDLFDTLPELLSLVPDGTTPVVFHSAVVAYLERPDRTRFQQLMKRLVVDGSCHWVSNEGRDVLPEVTATGPDAGDRPTAFVLGMDGRAVAFTHGHGLWMHWFGRSAH